MDPLALGALIGGVTLVVLFSGVPVAFGLGLVSIGVLWIAKGWLAVAFISEKLFNGLDDFTLISIPMFVLMGAAVASSRAGGDLYEALARWFHRLPGSLVAANIGACALFAALTGSSPATCAAIGKMGIPEMQKRGYRDDLATGAIAAGGTLGILIPPSLTMILYGIASETSIGRLFLAGAVPGLMLTALFIAWASFLCWRRGDGRAVDKVAYRLRDHLEMVPRVVPFFAVVAGVVYSMYGGYATPSEAASVGALLCLVLVVAIYRTWRPRALWRIFADTTRESVMILMIIGTSILFGYMMSDLRVTQSIAEWIARLGLNRWILMLWINLFLLVLGCFLPPAAIILMTTPILMPILTSSGFDAVWFGVILTINMELGLITPPVGLNLYVINGIAPTVRLGVILKGALPFMVCMVIGMVLLCLFPGIATWLPDAVMGPALEIG
ncbi:MAG: TRAP transporter large permease [Proteobacteria bacterium]|nr:TRAP transporter large permease [Pseudomonadota bacterium]